MIAGIGTDIIEIERIGKAVERNGFLEKYFTEAEIFIIKKSDLRKVSVAAGNFAAKEAVSKALGTGFSGFGPVEIEILRDNKGRPHAILHGEAKTLANNIGIREIHISISHCKEYATAFAVAERSS